MEKKVFFSRPFFPSLSFPILQIVLILQIRTAQEGCGDRGIHRGPEGPGSGAVEAKRKAEEPGDILKTRH
jgi:hypothetical protein